MLNKKLKKMKKIFTILIAFILCGSIIKAQVNLQNGLIANYPFNGNANDISGNAFNGNIYGASPTSDRFGNANGALSFNGIDNYITANINVYQQITFAFWYNSANIQNLYSDFIGYRNSYIQLIQSPSTIYARLQKPTDPSYEIRPNFTPSFGNWHHIVVFFDYSSNLIKLTIDDVLKYTSIAVGSGGYDPLWDNGAIIIGAHQGDLNPFTLFNGKLDNFHIYNRELNDLEISALYSEQDFEISTLNQTPKVGRIIEIPVNTNALTISDNVISYQFDYNYNNTKLEYIGNSLVGTWAENGSLQVNSVSAGKLSIAWARQIPMTGTGTGAIIKLQFKSIDAGIATPSITNAKFNETNITNITNGTITATYLYGDVTANDEITAYDAAIALQYSIGISPIGFPTPWENWRIEVADVDNDNIITANDASLILQYTVGIINVFPAGKKSGTKDNANVTITNENGFLVFRSSGDLFGLNVFVNENKQYLGTPEILNSNMISATNITTTNYAIGTATAYAPTNGDIFMKIPYTAGQNVSVTFDMIVNSTNLQVTVSLVTGIVQINDNAILVYPNPANNYLFVNGLNENTKISIYDLNGKLVFNKQSTNNQINISSFQSGVYTMKIETVKGIITKKFVKQ